MLDQIEHLVYMTDAPVVTLLHHDEVPTDAGAATAGDSHHYRNRIVTHRVAAVTGLGAAGDKSICLVKPVVVALKIDSRSNTPAAELVENLWYAPL